MSAGLQWSGGGWRACIVHCLVHAWGADALVSPRTAFLACLSVGGLVSSPIAGVSWIHCVAWHVIGGGVVRTICDE